MTSIRKILPAAALAGFALAGTVQAQTVIVINPENAAELRANVEASMRAAKRGESVGMNSGRQNPASRTLRGGMVEQELDASTLMHSVARIGADGKLERVCVTGDMADKALSAPNFAKRMTPAKEAFDVK